MKLPAKNTLRIKIKGEEGAAPEKLLVRWSTPTQTVERIVSSSTGVATFHGVPHGEVTVSVRRTRGATDLVATQTMTQGGSHELELAHQSTQADAPITSSNITVGGKHFVDWFNQDFKKLHKGNHPSIVLWGHPVPKFGHVVMKNSFCFVFDHCSDLWAKELTLPEFLTLFCVMYNETGGKFIPISELGSEKYMFEGKNGKASYNASPNRPAGVLLRARGVIAPGDEATFHAWNSTKVYPDPQGPILRLAAHECDFWKFRGRGLCQITWRNAYVAIVDPLLTVHGLPTCEDLSEVFLGLIIQTFHTIYLPMVKGYFKQAAGAFAKVNNDPPDWSAFGKGISGSKEYGQLLQWRCKTLYDAMRAAGYKTTP